MDSAIGLIVLFLISLPFRWLKWAFDHDFPSKSKPGEQGKRDGAADSQKKPTGFEDREL